MFRLRPVEQAAGSQLGQSLPYCHGRA